MVVELVLHGVRAFGLTSCLLPVLSNEPDRPAVEDRPAQSPLELVQVGPVPGLGLEPSHSLVSANTRPSQGDRIPVVREQRPGIQVTTPDTDRVPGPGVRSPGPIGPSVPSKRSP